MTVPRQSRKAEAPVKVLFLAWGFSIHAQRRVSVFADDDAFEVWLASNHAYKNLDVNRIYLEGAAETGEENRAETEGSLSTQDKRTIPGSRKGRSFTRRVKDTLFGWQWFCKLYITYRELRACVLDYSTLRQRVKDLEPDVIFSQTLMYPAFLSVLLPKRYPLVVTFWNGDILFWASFKGFERLLKKWIVTRGIRRARAITVNSSAMQEKVVELGGAVDKVHMIRYPGVDRSRFFPCRKENALRRLNLSGKKVILCPRGLGSYLNSDIILEAAALICHRHEDVLFVFVSSAGGEEELQQHKAMASELGIAAHLLWVGQIPWEVMPDYYRASEAVVSISSKDSLPNCMLEGMACGVPLILGDIPQLGEWVADRRNALLVPPRDAAALGRELERILSGQNPEVICEMVANNLRLVEEHFDSQVNSHQVKSLVRSLAMNQ